MDHIGVADIDDADVAAGKVDEVVLRIVCAVADCEELGGVPEALRSEARAGADLGAEIERRAHDRDIGLDGVPVRLMRLLHEGVDADERQVEPGGSGAVWRFGPGKASPEWRNCCGREA